VKFLVDEDLPRSVVELLRGCGHEAISAREAGLGGAKDSKIAAYAKSKGFCLLTGDFDFSDIRNYPPSNYHGLVIVAPPKDATARFITNLIKGFVEQTKLVTAISGRLIIIEPGRIRIRKDIR